MAPPAPATTEISAAAMAPVANTPLTPASPRTVVTPSHPGTATEARPGTDHGANIPVPPRTAPRAKAARLTTHLIKGSRTTIRPTTPSQETLPATEIAINLAELVARTTGYHNGLNEIEAALFQLDELRNQPSDTRQKLALAQGSLRQLRLLIGDYRFIKLYYGLLTEKQRLTVTAPRSPVTLCQRFSQCLDQWASPREDDYLRSFDGELPESQQSAIRVVRDDLAAMVSRAGD